MIWCLLLLLLVLLHLGTRISTVELGFSLDNQTFARDHQEVFFLHPPQVICTPSDSAADATAPRHKNSNSWTGFHQHQQQQKRRSAGPQKFHHHQLIIFSSSFRFAAFSDTAELKLTDWTSSSSSLCVVAIWNTLENLTHLCRLAFLRDFIKG